MHGGGGADLLAIYGLAERLGKFAHEVLEMPEQELHGWIAYFDHQKQLTNNHG